MSVGLEERQMAAEKAKYELTKIDSETLELARLVVAMERRVKGKEKVKTLSDYLSDILRPKVRSDYDRVKKQLDQTSE